MQVLHIVAPSDPLTSPEIMGLIRLTQQQVGGQHKTLVIGGDVETKYLQSCGIPVLGSVPGPMDVSKTLASRVNRLIELHSEGNLLNVIAWGWSATTMLCGLETSVRKIGFVDGIHHSVSRSSIDFTVIPSSWRGSDILVDSGINSNVIAEPLIGVEPTSCVADRSIVEDELQINNTNRFVYVVGNRASWQEILEMVFRMHSTGMELVFILPPYYAYRVQLMLEAKKRGLGKFIITTPARLRSIDVLVHADCVWAPNAASFDTTSTVLDVLKAAWEHVPIAAQCTHPVHSVPTLGSNIAWARDSIDVSSWIIDSIRGTNREGTRASEVNASVRSIAAPSRFIEGLLQRISANALLRCS
jgi:hypothetical protein